MQVVYPRCAALDLGKDVLVAAVRVQDAGGVSCECRTYGTTANQLSTLRGWLISHGVTHVVMEATGSYWKCVWRALEGPHVGEPEADPQPAGPKERRQGCPSYRRFSRSRVDPRQLRPPGGDRCRARTHTYTKAIRA